MTARMRIGEAKPPECYSDSDVCAPEWPSLLRECRGLPDAILSFGRVPLLTGSRTEPVLDMQIPTIDARALTASGIAALRRGDAQTARALLEQIVTAGQADASRCFSLALACGHPNDTAAAHGSVDQVLALQPRHLRALVLKGDLLAK